MKLCTNCNVDMDIKTNIVWLEIMYNEHMGSLVDD